MTTIKFGGKRRHIKIPEGHHVVVAGVAECGDLYLNIRDYTWRSVVTDGFTGDPVTGDGASDGSDFRDTVVIRPDHTTDGFFIGSRKLQNGG